MSDVLATLFHDGRIMDLDPGQRLFSAETLVHRMYLVTKGRVDLVRHSEWGASLVFARAGPGAIIAEASAYAPHYHCDGIAGEASCLTAIARTTFLTRLAARPDAMETWAKHLAGGLQEARILAEIRALKTVSHRLDAWLDGGRVLPPRGQLQDVAQTLGVSREALYRELARRKRAGALQAGGRRALHR